MSKPSNSLKLNAYFNIQELINRLEGITDQPGVQLLFEFIAIYKANKWTNLFKKNNTINFEAYELYYQSMLKPIYVVDRKLNLLF